MAKQVLKEDYRYSHATKDYGKKYHEFYSPGTYSYCVWEEEQDILKRIFDKYSIDKDTMIIDFACGTGRIIDFIAMNYKPKKIVGVDISVEMLKVAKKLFAKRQNVELIQGDLTVDKKLQQKIKSYDIKYITAFRFFTNAQQELREQALEAFTKVAKPGTYLVTNIHQRPFSLYAVYKVLRTIKAFVTGRKDLLRFNMLGFKKFERLLNKYGFEVAEVYNVTWTIPAGFKKLAKSCKVLHFLMKCPIKYIFPSESIIVAKYKSSA